MASLSNEKKSSASLFNAAIHNSLRLMGVVWAERKGVVVAQGIAIGLLAFMPFVRSGAMALLLNELARSVGGGAVSSHLTLYIVLFLVAGFLPPFLYGFLSYIERLFWFFTEEKFEVLITQKKGEIDVAVHEDPKHRDLFNMVQERGTWNLQSFIERQMYIGQNVIQVAIAAFILIAAQWWVFVIVLLGTLPELISEIKYGRLVWGIHSDRAERRRRFYSVRSHFDDVSSIVELKLFQNTAHFVSIIKDLFKNFHKDELANERLRLIRSLFVILLAQAVIVFAAFWFITKVVHGGMQLGTLTFILASIGDLRQALSGMFTSLGRQYQDSLYVTDVFRLLDIKPTVARPGKGVVLDPGRTPEIVFENVTFNYPDTDIPVLKNFSLHIAPGEKIAFVGMNGAGKTTIIKLLCRFYDPTAGRILVGGHDLRSLDLDSWYHALGIIFQDYNRYHFIVREAIAVGRTNAKETLGRVKDAARAAEADVFIEEWEKQYDQMLGKEFSEGSEPSIGQWQKLALARTFYRDPRIFVLDEPTSSIDAEAESKIFEKLEHLPDDRTVILISHRFSTVRHANQIAVIDGGVRKELGTHEELLKIPNGIYARLFHLQAKGYT